MENNYTAGMGDPYWYEWSVGLLHVLDMLTNCNIKHIILQANHMQGLDDILRVYNDDSADCIQIKHTRIGDTLTFSNLISKTSTKPSLLRAFSKDWKKAKDDMYTSCNPILFSNRAISTRKFTVRKEEAVQYEIPPLEDFWEWLKKELKTDKCLNEITVPSNWMHSWNLWLI
jgi:hypothetical protein